MIYTLKQALKQFARNGAMASASVFSITAILLILGVVFLLIVNVTNITETVRSDFDTIEVYLLDSTERADADAIMKELAAAPEVTEVRYKSKEEALEAFKVKFGDKAYLLEMRQSNPLPNSLVVKVGKIEDCDAVVGMVRRHEGVENINYYKETIDKLVRMTTFIQYGALAVILALLIISVVVVSNTIKLMVLGREREISIMKYVGATNWFIRGPFLVEGILIGLISALISLGVVYLMYHRFEQAFGTDMIVMLSTNLVPERFMMANLSVIFAALGVSIGACGSIISMRRFLDT
ncbi:MAG: permease-like cell division protein FtsX [Clostridiales Family XIII bacterium]|jgi:cell division transport system permease protein|nr:permease-like cell division protein FtsX [Clostridiales Family XIII bacterium]